MRNLLAPLAVVFATASLSMVRAPGGESRVLTARALPEGVANDNTKPAGALRNGVLTVNLFAASANWRPGPSDAPPVEVLLFGEEGHAPSNPGPLLRVPLGTSIDLSLRNAFRDSVQISAICPLPCLTGNMVRVAPGATGHLRFTPSNAGTFVYWGAPLRGGRVELSEEGSQFTGVIVVDSGSAKPDRIITISAYDHVRDEKDPSKGNRLIFAFNGKVWPYTERYTYSVGDSIRWRVVHLGGGEHPMHLHGFYFRVERRGDGATDRAIPPDQQPVVVTEEVGTLGTFEMVWSPDRAGNWLFHCHKPVHMARQLIDAVFDRLPDTTQHPMSMSDDHAMSGMSGLVLGITVKPKTGVQSAAATAPSSASVRRMRLVAQKIGPTYGEHEMLGYSLAGDRVPAKSKPSGPGPTIFVTRGEPTEITVVNQLAEPTAVHWHGIELESYFDGVAGWSGAGARVAPLIAPKDSFVARFTAPRVGTFIYHTHANDADQLMTGLYGALVVLEPGQSWNDTTDHVFVVGDAPDWTVLNGSPSPARMTLKAGVPHRLRFVSMMIDDETDVTISRADSVASWKPLAKDAIPVRATQSAPARLHFGPGETYDFEFTPSRGEYEMKVSAYTKVLLTIVAR